ncbi:hypothetical protein EVG20_g1246 [Dentipellis fragilis]|uniref:Uncharacterized protein n=1 Tax=Dentipellis fragilis TaxID=205917 RepID=A0A4Y9ZEB6_9AGAM|nr:hypothetical protein EVG20_g1246 [Dentipellis fragilis]
MTDYERLNNTILKVFKDDLDYLKSPKFKVNDNDEYGLYLPLLPIFRRIVRLGELDRKYCPGDDENPHKTYEILTKEHPEFIRLLMDSTVASWSREFRGDSADLLYKILKSYCEPPRSGPGPYARHAAFVQSSGTGKSRQIDELAKRITCIPINLQERNESSLPYPPADDKEFRDWLRFDDGVQSQNELRKHYQAFLFSIMDETQKRLSDIQKVNSNILSNDQIESLVQGGTQKSMKITELVLDRLSMLAREFRQKMTETVPEAGVGAENSSPDSGGGLHSPTTYYSVVELDRNTFTAGENLWKFLDPTQQLDGPLLVFSFDEAHSLTKPIEHKSWTRFLEIRRGLRALNKMPFFAIFLSTAGKFHHFAPNHDFDPSNRIKLLDCDLYVPITEIGFDDFANRISEDGTWHLGRLASTHHIAHLGRALFHAHYDDGDESVRKDIVSFASVKLMAGYIQRTELLNDDQKLACLAVRLGVDFRATGWLHQEKERTQVERHMRLCLSASEGFRNIITIAPSEPVLAEAAFRAMDGWDVPAALLSHIDSSYLSIGERGELIASLLVLAARDAAVKSRPSSPHSLEDDGRARVTSVVDFLHQDKHLAKDFEGADIWFNHLIKVHDFAVINQEYLWMILSRGAAVICANHRRGVDIVIPILFKNNLLKKNVSAILIQVKNDLSFTDTVRTALFDGMSPFDIGLFSENVAEPLPIIRIVFALASKKPAVRSNDVPQRTSPRIGEIENRGNTKAFTAYDIWFAGASHETFKVITPEQDSTYQCLLARSHNFFNAYTPDIGGSPSAKEDRGRARRGMHPVVFSQVEHYRKFVNSSAGESAPQGVKRKRPETSD